ncbi:PREDICTED: cysteine-rich receptor-like protein kinase 3 [Tarenaya hassleriana]|uniref:cysteine-rich receptor-like protein kinase 3 n=1 Tax=Tarenaya hassleriana TaxID=28532 RepID=UPI00053C8430|nr:PREDICTED: cysteine-rich receptor-like protein kinase 3 [Tarenaya hassleriana]
MPIFSSRVPVASISVLLLLGILVNPTISDSRGTTVGLICSNRTSAAEDRNVYIDNFLAAMDAVSPPVATDGYARVNRGGGNNTVYAYGECLKDLDKKDCDLCFAQIKTQVPRCLPFQRATRGARVFSDGCYIRYDDYPFYNETVSPEDRTVCANNTVTGLNQTVFGENAAELVRNMSVQAVNGGFYAGFVDRQNVTVHGLAQCWEPLNRSGCQHCLGKAANAIASCFVREEGRSLNAGCYMRFSTQKFYNNSGDSSSGGNNGRNHLAVALAVTSSVVAFVLVASAVTFFLKKKLARKRREKKQLGSLFRMANNSSLCFSYETLEKATNYFSHSNKLGQGGSGSVYKGILPDGKTVAVKRLFFNTRQWVDHFFNEVNLISRIQHKNLVKLLGCSLTGPESLLVYEYVGNQSLYDYLFVRKDVEPLSWEKRIKIILEIAEGLAYLHEESNLRIIHRDIKLSNVLLDYDFTPKIADFGLARLFPEDQSHISTAVAGTLGYMAPEYIVRGKLTEKADVYSFGVLMIEVISGRRNNAFSQNSSSILQMVWSLYGTRTLREAVDPIMGDNFDVEEAKRVMKIGLLCVQAAFDQRPAMSSVVKMMTGREEIPEPTQPPFLNTASAESSRVFSPTSYLPHKDQSQSSASRNSITESFMDPR